MKKILLISTLLFFVCAMAYSQTKIIMNGSQAPTATGCNMKVVDGGNESGNYAPSTNTMVTLISNSTTTPCMRVSVTSLDIHSSDTLYIYDGDNTSAPLLAKLNNSNYMGAAYSYIYMASITSTKNITIHFVSDGANEGAGFVIETDCVKECQRVFIELDSANCTHIPALDPRRPEDPNLYVNVCPYDSVIIAVKGIYPDNGVGGYTQSDAVTKFTYDYGDTVVKGTGLTSHSYKFRPARGYTVSLTAEDQELCNTQIPLTFRVRNSDNPISKIMKFKDVCTGEKVVFRTGYDMYADFQMDSVGSEQLSTLSVTDTIFLPDQVDCGPPNYHLYRSSVLFTAFSPNAAITQAGDILYVRLCIEHSYIGDIGIRLNCPTGQRAVLEPDKQGGYRYLGNAYDDAGLRNCSGNSPKGIGYNYVWSENTDPRRGYQYAGGGTGVFLYQGNTGSNGTLLGTGPIIDSSDVNAKTGFYKPGTSFSNMIGCPLNGEWQIEVEDMLGLDDGWIFGWEMALSEYLLPQNWSFKVDIVDTYITGPGAEAGYVIPNVAGDLDYIVTFVDEYGCEYDTTFSITAVASPKPDLGPDMELCTGDMLHLNANFEDSTANYQWNTGSKEDNIYVVSQGDYIVRVTTYNADSSLVCTAHDTINVKYYAAPHAKFEASTTASCSPLKFVFRDLSLPEDVEMTQVWRIFNQPGTLVYESTLPAPEVTLVEPGKYHVQLIVTTDLGCVDSTIVYNYLEVFPQPYAEFEAEPEVSLISETGGEVYFRNYTDSLIATSEGVSWHWDFGDGTSDSSALSLAHTYASWGDYIVTFYISSSQGCADEISHRVVIEDDLIFPNVITPNGDGFNDVFAIGNLNTSINPIDPDNFRHNELLIYDRWGKLVYKANDYDTYSKDGEIFVGSQFFDGAGLPDGVYYFTLYFKGKAKTIDYHGSLTILRGK